LKAEPNITLRAAEPSDADAIALVLAKAFAEFKPLYTAEAYAATTPKSDVILNRSAEGQTCVALLDDEIVGTISAIPRGADVHIRSMAVVPQARGNRIGERLLQYIEDLVAQNNVKRLTLSTTPFLHSAIRLYERFGFACNGTNDLHGTPLITMHKDL
jgi:GNAT superfamily N-acetyltransferase